MKKTTEPPNRTAVIISTLIVIGLCLFVVFGVKSCVDGGGDTDQATPTIAALACEDFVKERLKSPYSAKFQSTYSQSSTETSLDQFTVVAYVDSENSFGSMVRTNYLCKIRYVPSSDQWQLVNLTADP